MILDGRDRFYQWDLDRKLIVTDESIDEVHFCNRTDDCSLVCEVYTEGELRLVNVPNILLQKDWRINVYAFDGSYTKVHEIFEVERRTKPADYIYTETEIKNYDDLAARVQQIEENGISDEAVESAVERYLDENDIKVDLTGYATETYVDEKIEAIELTPGPEGKPGKDGQDGKDGVDGKDYVLTDADKQEIAGMVEVTGGSGEVDLTGYATEEYVDSKWEGYPDKQDVATKGYVTSSITGRGYITSEQAQEKIDNAIAGIEHPAPDLSGYATEQYVDDAIAAIDIPSGGGGSGEGVEEVYVGTKAPDSAEYKIWIDTDDDTPYVIKEEFDGESIIIEDGKIKTSLGGGRALVAAEKVLSDLTTPRTCEESGWGAIVLTETEFGLTTEAKAMGLTYYTTWPSTNRYNIEYTLEKNDGTIIHKLYENLTMTDSRLYMNDDYFMFFYWESRKPTIYVNWSSQDFYNNWQMTEFKISIPAQYEYQKIGADFIPVDGTSIVSAGGVLSAGLNRLSNSTGSTGVYGQSADANSYGLCWGNNSRTDEACAVAFGYNTIVKYSYGGAAIGYEAEARDGWGAVALNQTIANSYNQTTVGQFNVVDNNARYAFIVGCGEDSSNRKNGFAVRKDGDTEIVNGLIMYSPNGTAWRITIDDSGALKTATL